MFRTIFNTLRALLKSGLCGPQLCIRSDTASRGLNRRKCERVWKREWMNQSSNLGGRSFCQSALVSWPLNLWVWNTFGINLKFLLFNEILLQNTNLPRSCNFNNTSIYILAYFSAFIFLKYLSGEAVETKRLPSWPLKAYQTDCATVKRFSR